MKKIKYILSAAVLTLFLVGCDVQEASQDAAPVAGTDDYPTASFTFSGPAAPSDRHACRETQALSSVRAA